MNGTRLGDAELDIMRVLWNGTGPMTSADVRAGVADRRSWALSSLMTALERLCAKGFASCDRSTRTNLYTPQISEADYRAHEGASILEKLYDNSVGNLVASLYDGKVIGERELSELRTLIDRLEGSDGT